MITNIWYLQTLLTGVHSSLRIVVLLSKWYVTVLLCQNVKKWVNILVDSYNFSVFMKKINTHKVVFIVIIVVFRYVSGILCQNLKTCDILVDFYNSSLFMQKYPKGVCCCIVVFYRTLVTKCENMLKFY